MAQWLNAPAFHPVPERKQEDAGRAGRCRLWALGCLISFSPWSSVSSQEGAAARVPGQRRLLWLGALGME